MTMIIFSGLEQKYLAGMAALDVLCFAQPWSIEMFEGEVNSNMARYVVATRNDQVVGYAGLWKVLDEGQITNVAVHPDCRRQGIAKELLERLFAMAVAENLSFLTLEVREGNNAAIALYQELGFATVGRREHYYADKDEAAILMTKQLVV